MSDKIRALDAGLPLGDGGIAPALTGIAASSLGAQFVRSDVFEWLRSTKKTRPGKWESPTAELAWPRGGLYAATITTGGGTLVVPVDRGLVPPPPAQPHVADLFAGGPTEGPVSYLVETVFTNNAAPVAEGAAKPESGITFERRVDALSKLSHWVPVTDEALEDVPQLAVYIDTRLREGVLLKEDTQLLSGDGVAPNILGVLNRPGLGAPLARAASESSADAIGRQASTLAIATGTPMSGIVMNPADWAAIETSKDDAGAYLGGGPFMPLPTRTLWGIPVALTPAMTLGSALVGGFASAGAVFRKGGLRVSVSNSHADFFIKNLVAVLAETRVSLAIFRPAAFGLVTNLGPVTP